MLNVAGGDTVSAGAGGVDDAADTMTAGSVEDVEGAGGADGVHARGLLDAALDRGDRAKVEDEAGPAHGGIDGRGVGEVAVNDFRRWPYAGKVLTHPGAEVVEDANRSSTRRQCFDQVRANEPRPTCHQTQLRHKRGKKRIATKNTKRHKKKANKIERASEQSGTQPSYALEKRRPGMAPSRSWLLFASFRVFLCFLWLFSSSEFRAQPMAAR